MNETKFLYPELVYTEFVQNIERNTGLKLTEFEAGLCRALLDIKSKNSEMAGAALGSKFKEETKRFIAKKLLHKDSFKYTGMAIPTGVLKEVINATIQVAAK